MMLKTIQTIYFLKAYHLVEIMAKTETYKVLQRKNVCVQSYVV